MKNQRKQKDFNQVFYVLTNIFLLFLMGIYPIFQTGSYSTLLQAKTGFLYLVLLFFGGTFTIVGVYRLLHRSSKIEGNAITKRWSMTDCAVLAFLIVSIVSWLINDNKKELFWGGYGRNVGLLVIIACVAIYFVCSRFGDIKQWVLLAILFVMVLVMFIEVCNHLGWDVINMYTDMKDRATLLSPLGNLMVLTSYLALILPISIGLFLLAQEKVSEWIYGGVSFMGFLGMYAAGTDSAYLVMAVLFLVSLILSKGNEQGQKWCILLMEVLTAGLVLRFLRWHADEACMKLESTLTSFVLESSAMLFIMVILLLVTLVLTICMYKKKEKWAMIRKGILIGCAIGVCVLLVIVLVLNFASDEETAKEALGGLGRYLYFDDDWGTKRIQIWRLGMTAFIRMPFWEKCVGCGPSGFFFALREYLVETDMANVTVRGVLVDAHSVYLQLLVCQGILGLGCYIFAFLSGLSKCKFTCERNLQVVIYVLWMTSFLVQALVNNIHIYTEPMCFAMLGLWMRGLNGEDE